MLRKIKLSPLSTQIADLYSQFTCHMEKNEISIVFKTLDLDF